MLQLGKTQLSGGRYGAAVESLETLERVAPRSGLKAEGHLFRAEALARLDRTEEAEKLLKPLVDEGLVPTDYPLVIHAVSGYSGRGRAGLEDHEGAGAANALPYQVYGLGLNHKHVPEIQQHAGLAHAPVFVPAYGHYRQGIVLTMALHLRLLPAGVTAA
ncbi:MAG: hypothetical protein ACXU95_17750, partial [Isosphaeraceae bacterium]